MNSVSVLGSAFVTSGFVAWTMCRAAARGDATADSHIPFSAPANDASGSDGGAVAARFPRGSLMKALREGFPSLPVRMRTLPRDDAGLPIPYLLTLIDGRAEMSRADHAKAAACHAQQRCWLCGDKLGKYTAFMTEALAAVTRISRTPPAHQDCAKYAAQAGLLQAPGVNVSLVWVSRSHGVRVSHGAQLFILGDAEQTFWYSDGRLATRDEVQRSMEVGLPSLYAVAQEGGNEAVMGLDLQVARATRQFPPHAALATPA